MPLLPDKPNPPPRSIAQPDAETRRCTKCLERKPHADFRWLWINIRKASHCKACERAQRQLVAARKNAPSQPLGSRPYSLGPLKPASAPPRVFVVICLGTLPQFRNRETR